MTLSLMTLTSKVLPKNEHIIYEQSGSLQNFSVLNPYELPKIPALLLEERNRSDKLGAPFLHAKTENEYPLQASLRERLEF